MALIKLSTNFKLMKQPLGFEEITKIILFIIILKQTLKNLITLFF
jgi:hypothetical protein